ncbi:MAG TPA: universal stress protein [Candidatus Limnocylindria bacterium]|nr:universal stress protein [Candidatus Limnocylindria bacterium]
MRVLLAYDDSAGARKARDLVADMNLPGGSVVTVATVLEGANDVIGAMTGGFAQGEDAATELVAELREMLSAAAEPIRARCRVDVQVLRGRPAPAVIAEAELMKADLIVVGSRGHGPFASIMLGSVSTELVDHAPCPVLIARTPQVRRIVIGTDGSDSAASAIELVRGWPVLSSLPCAVVAVAPTTDTWAIAYGPAAVGHWPVGAEDVERDTFDHATRNAEVAAAALRDAGIEPTVEVRRGDAADQLIATADAEEADLIVVGSRGLATWSRLLLGSVARKVVQHARQSVLVVRGSREMAGAATAQPKVTASSAG